MNIETVEKAKKLQERINKLQSMIADLRPEHCNGIAFKGYPVKNENMAYKHHLWSTHASNTDDNSLIMRNGITSMYNKACILLEEAEKELEEL